MDSGQIVGAVMPSFEIETPAMKRGIHICRALRRELEIFLNDLQGTFVHSIGSHSITVLLVIGIVSLNAPRNANAHVFL